MLNCPFCHTDLSTNGVEDGRCFACGSLVVWQDDTAEKQEVSEHTRTVAGIIGAVGAAGAQALGPSAAVADEPPVDGPAASDMGQATVDLDRLPGTSPEARVSPGLGSALAPARFHDGPSLIQSNSSPGQGNLDRTIDGYQPSSVSPNSAAPGTDARSTPPQKELSRDDVARMQTVWQLTESATPRTSLKAPQPRSLDSSQQRRLQTLWQGTLSGSASPHASLKSPDAKSPDAKSPDAQQGPRKSTLVIGARALHHTTDPHNRDADYELLDMIGEGGMGMVYEARQACMDRIVAVKMLRKEISADADQRDKFLSEAVVTAELDHPNIVPIHDLGSNEAGDLFYSMKRVQGTPWSEVIAQRTQEEHLEILMKVCDAVAFAHQRGVIHRDLKPENIMLGDFGEVLVMDWGLAMPTQEFRRKDSVTQSCSMGGTPAYMAPEMATGPIESIDRRSDVYLLGAILFEVISGETPHTGKDTMDCLYAAARNDIQPTSETGELMDIALRAMETRPEKRFQSVQDFKSAIRDYQEHAESITLSNRAAAELRGALDSNNYQEFAAALYGYKEALALWGGNAKAAVGLKKAALAYARCAVDKKDFDLAASLLDPAEASHRDLSRRIDVARRERDSRAQRLRNLRLLAVTLGAVMFGTVFVAYVWIRRDRNAAREYAAFAIQQKKNAEEQRKAANAQRRLAEAAAAQAEQAAQDESAARKAAERAKAAEQYESYLAKIQLVAEKIEANAFREAGALLQLSSDSPHKHWEWGRSQYLCREFARRWNTEGQVECVAFAPNGAYFAAGSSTGIAWLWTKSDQDEPLRIANDGNAVGALAFDGEGDYLTIGAADGQIRVVDVGRGETVVQFHAHGAAVLSIAIAQQTPRMITSGLDKTIAIWDISDITNPRLLQRIARHGFILDIATTPDARTLVTGGQDGYATVWRSGASDGPPGYRVVTKFSAHEGPVYCVALAPDGYHCASGGYDKRVLVWDLRRVEPVDLRKIANNIAAEPPVYRALHDHRAAVQSVAFSPDGKRIVSGSMDNTIRVWDAISGELYRTLRGHAFGVRSCAFSPDGTRILSGSHDRSVRLWDVGNYHEVRLLKTRNLVAHKDAVMSARYSHDGNWIVTSSRDRSAILWNVAANQPTQILEEGHEYMATNLQFFADGTRIVTGGGDDTVRIWDVLSGAECLRLDRAGRNGVLALSADESLVATGDKEDIQLWDVRSGKRLATWQGHKANVSSLAISRDNRWVVSADLKGTINLWSRASAEPIWSVRGHSGMVTVCQFLPDGQRIITASADHTVTQWDVNTGQEVPDQVLPHPGWVSHLKLTSNGDRAITVCDDNVVRVWNMQTREVLGTLLAPAGADTVANNLRRYMRMQKWSVDELATAAGIPASSIDPLLNSDQDAARDKSRITAIAAALRVSTTSLQHPKVDGIALSRDGNRVLTTMSQQRACRLWDLPTFQEIRGTESDGTGSPFLQSQRGTILWAAEFSPDGQQIATIGGNEIRLWDTESRRQLMTFSPHGTVASTDFSPDGKTVVTAGWDFSAKLWDTETGRPRQKLIGGHTGRINSVAFSPDGAHLATASDDGTVRFWDVNLGTLLPHALRGHDDAVMSVRYTPTGDRLVTASRDGTVRLWNAADGTQLLVLSDPALQAPATPDSTGVTDGQPSGKSHQFAALCADFFIPPSSTSPSSTSPSSASPASAVYVVSGGADATAKIWDARDGQLLQSLQGHIGSVQCVAVSPDGKRVITGSDDATAKLWDATTGKEVMTLTGHERSITSVSFSPAGQDVLTSSLDGLAIVWPAEPWDNTADGNANSPDDTLATHHPSEPLERTP